MLVWVGKSPLFLKMSASFPVTGRQVAGKLCVTEGISLNAYGSSTTILYHRSIDNLEGASPFVQANFEVGIDGTTGCGRAYTGAPFNMKCAVGC